MRSIRLADALYRPVVGIMTFSVVLQLFCIIVKIFS